MIFQKVQFFPFLTLKTTNTMNKREQDLSFILTDTKQRGEEITSDITFLGALYQCKVKKEGENRSKTVNYSAAKDVMQGYRAINVKYTPDEIKKMAEDFVEKHMPKWECKCSVCGTINCRSNDTCINCNCQLT